MTNEQLYLAIGVPIVFNTLITTLFWFHVNSRFAAFDRNMNQRFNDMRDLWKAELHRVEGIIDARLKHLEEEKN